jgi:hypothetical protein
MMLTALYGTKFDELLGNRVISFSKEIKKLNAGRIDKTKLILRCIALVLCLS